MVGGTVLGLDRGRRVALGIDPWADWACCVPRWNLALMQSPSRSTWQDGSWWKVGFECTTKSG